jgi:hypothetical protein
LIDLQTKDILYINATLISGALIFLTLSSFSAPTHEEKISRAYSIVYGAGIVFTFSYSSIKVMFGNNDKALFITKFSFIYLVIGAILFAIVSFADVVGWF